MRTLIYVPVIHTSADLGSLAKDVTKRGIADIGEDVWDKHKAAVEKFWDVISDYFGSIDVSGKKIYQDGMVADGEVGERIVEEGAKSGSRNYELVARLLKRGAILVKTEDFKLVKEELERLTALTQAKSIAHKLIAFIKYKLVKDRLLDKRDKFIAKRIDESLRQDETGIIFIGAYHNIKKRLPGSMRVGEIKDARIVKEYQMLLPFYQKHKERFEELSRYLISKPEGNGLPSDRQSHKPEGNGLPSDRQSHKVSNSSAPGSIRRCHCEPRRAKQSLLRLLRRYRSSQ